MVAAFDHAGYVAPSTAHVQVAAVLEAYVSLSSPRMVVFAVVAFAIDRASAIVVAAAEELPRESVDAVAAVGAVPEPDRHCSPSETAPGGSAFPSASRSAPTVLASPSCEVANSPWQGTGGLASREIGVSTCRIVR